jgi:hypothetical protein
MLSSTSIAADEIEGTDVPVIVFVMSVSCLVVIQWITLGELVWFIDAGSSYRYHPLPGDLRVDGSIVAHVGI